MVERETGPQLSDGNDREKDIRQAKKNLESLFEEVYGADVSKRYNWESDNIDTRIVKSSQLVEKANGANSIDELYQILSRGEVILMKGMISPATDQTRMEDKVTPQGLACQIKSMGKDLKANPNKYELVVMRMVKIFLDNYGLSRAVELLGLSEFN